MKIIRNSSEDEMILAFLSGEINSKRFGEELRRVIIELGNSPDIILSGDYTSESQNKVRRDILSKFRGYPDREIFDNYPKNINWVLVSFESTDLCKLRYIDYSYWNELSNGTSCPIDAAINIENGVEIFGVSNKNFLDGKNALETGAAFPPVIALASDDKCIILLEGHARATAYALAPKYFTNTPGFIGFCSEEELIKKEPGKFKIG